MTNIIKILLFIFGILLLSCTKEEKISVIEQENVETQMIESFREGYEELDKGDVLYAAKKFNEAEILFPQSAWAPKSALMAAYSYYTQDYYGDAIFELKRFLKNYPSNDNYPYAYFLLATCYYETIKDEKKDLSALLRSKEYFKIVVEKYDKTIFVEEALHRLVEVYYKIGLTEEAKQAAAILGYNYQSSEWYERSYKVFNKKYKSRKQRKKKKTLTLKVHRKIKNQNYPTEPRSKLQFLVISLF